MRANRLIAASVIVAVAVAILFVIWSRSIRERSVWIETQPPRGNHRAIALSTDAAFKSDIALPEISQISGKIKFLPVVGNRSAANLGYVVRIVVSKLDLSKVPAKYLHKRIIDFDGVQITRPPVDQVVYQSNLEFQLLDSDGFMLTTITGGNEAVRSGATNVLQAVVGQEISQEIVARTKKVTLLVSLTKCDTCESD